MTEDDALSHAELLAELQRLRARIIEMEDAIAAFVVSLAKPTPHEPQ